MTDKSALIERIAKRIKERELSGPAVVVLELLRPLGFVAGQLLLMLGPLFGETGGSRLAECAGVLEDREAVEALLAALDGHPRGHSARPPAA